MAPDHQNELRFVHLIAHEHNPHSHGTTSRHHRILPDNFLSLRSDRALRNVRCYAIEKNLNENEENRIETRKQKKKTYGPFYSTVRYRHDNFSIEVDNHRLDL